MLHRLIMGNPKGKLVDHRFGDTLDCRRDGLRISTHAQNAANRLARSGSVKGVQYRPRYKKWQASITRNRRRQVLGLFETMEQAAAAYDAAAVKLHGDFAWTNLCTTPIELARLAADRSRDRLAKAVKRARKLKGLPSPRRLDSAANIAIPPHPRDFPIHLPERVLHDEAEWRVYLHEELGRVKGGRFPSLKLPVKGTKNYRARRPKYYQPGKLAAALGVPLRQLRTWMSAGEFGELSNNLISAAGFKQFQQTRLASKRPD